MLLQSIFPSGLSRSPDQLLVNAVKVIAEEYLLEWMDCDIGEKDDTIIERSLY